MNLRSQKYVVTVSVVMTCHIFNMNSSPMSYAKDDQQVRKQLKAEEVLF
jgi:hypothetical protein